MMSLTTLLAMLPASLASAGVTFTVTIDDPGNALVPYHARLTSHLQAAGAAWAERLPGNANLTIRVRPTNSLAFSSGYSS
jgi:hypothetical protein